MPYLPEALMTAVWFRESGAVILSCSCWKMSIHCYALKVLSVVRVLKRYLVPLFFKTGFNNIFVKDFILKGVTICYCFVLKPATVFMDLYSSGLRFPNLLLFFWDRFFVVAQAVLTHYLSQASNPPVSTFLPSHFILYCIKFFIKF